jgi:hypothetical protein
MAGEVWSCPSCGLHLEGKHDECPRCGIVLVKYKAQIKRKEKESAQVVHSSEASEISASPGEIQSAWGIGVVVGLGTAGMFCFAGFVLSLTGIGIVIGVPLMLFGVALAFVAVPIGALITKKGYCPYCKGLLLFTGTGTTCSSCHKRIIVVGKNLAVVD